MVLETDGHILFLTFLAAEFPVLVAARYEVDAFSAKHMVVNGLSDFERDFDEEWAVLF